LDCIVSFALDISDLQMIYAMLILCGNIHIA